MRPSKDEQQPSWNNPDNPLGWLIYQDRHTRCSASARNMPRILRALVPWLYWFLQEPRKDAPMMGQSSCTTSTPFSFLHGAVLEAMPSPRYLLWHFPVSFDLVSDYFPARPSILYFWSDDWPEIGLVLPTVTRCVRLNQAWIQ